MFRTLLGERRVSNRRQITSPRQARSGISFLPPGQRWHRPHLERLEDRTLPSVGGQLNSVLTAMQTALNGHLFQPSVTYSLPLIGNDLGSDPNAQFLNKLGTAVQNAANPNNLTSIQAALAAVPGVGTSNVTITPPSGPASSQDGEITITGAQVNGLSGLVEAFNLGLPGLDTTNLPTSSYVSQVLQELSSQLMVNVTVTYDMSLFINFDSSGNVVLDSSRNGGSLPPLVSLNVTATPQSFPGGTLNLGPFTVMVGQGGNGVELSFTGLQFNVVSNPLGTYNAGNSLNFTGSNSNVIFGKGNLLNGATAIIDIALTVQMLDLPSLETDLDVTWTPAVGASDLFDNNNDLNSSNQHDLTLSFNVSVDLSSVANLINPIVTDIRDKLGPLTDIVSDINHVLTDPIPILSDIIPGTTLEDLITNPVLDAAAGVNTQDLKSLFQFLNTVSTILNWPGLGSSGNTIPLASISIPIDADARLSDFDLVGTLGSAVTTLNSASASAISSLKSTLSNLEPIRILNT